MCCGIDTKEIHIQEKTTRIDETYLEERYALVERENKVIMTITAIVDRIDPRRVPSKRSDGTLRYMSKLAAHLMVDLERNRLLDGVGLSSSSWSSLSECKKKSHQDGLFCGGVVLGNRCESGCLSLHLCGSLCVCVCLCDKR